jgi:hypothetical protein
MTLPKYITKQAYISIVPEGKITFMPLQHRFPNFIALPPPLINIS